jgi:hypothetical protein
MTLKAEESYRYDYWFTAVGIYRITILPWRYGIITAIGVYLVLAIADGYLGIPPLIYLILLFAGVIGVPSVLMRRSASNARTSLGPNPSGDVLEKQKGSRKITWDEIKSISLTRKHNLRILVGVHAYRGTFKSEDYEPLKSFLASKIGERLQIREGTI